LDAPNSWSAAATGTDHSAKCDSLGPISAANTPAPRKNSQGKYIAYEILFLAVGWVQQWNRKTYTGLPISRQYSHCLVSENYVTTD